MLEGGRESTIPHSSEQASQARQVMGKARGRWVGGRACDDHERAADLRHQATSNLACMFVRLWK
jgi:hypothetical protein